MGAAEAPPPVPGSKTQQLSSWADQGCARKAAHAGGCSHWVHSPWTGFWDGAAPARGSVICGELLWQEGDMEQGSGGKSANSQRGFPCPQL